ncbi:hypothetical protein [uncultured Chryseobacterium sp.]|uniref:hypothetical protein n=1 Tax=uncultured Chryseobacterium sp. TaxID=259322 RepID=UPI0025DDDAEA|nr:hypothetical protein [uncultured Chryseobacterium sp.]
MDIAMRFEDTVISIWGRPEFPIWFAGYYNSPNQKTFKSILLSLCIYEKNYNKSKYDDESLQILNEYESLAGSNDSSHTEDVNFLKFLYKKNVPHQREWE